MHKGFKDPRLFLGFVWSVVALTAILGISILRHLRQEPGRLKGAVLGDLNAKS
jgi:hypothetical protein